MKNVLTTETNLRQGYGKASTEDTEKRRREEKDKG